MFWAVSFIALKFTAAILVIYAIAEFIAWKAIREYEAEKKKKVVDCIPYDCEGY